jgi:hypothetical protein
VTQDKYLVLILLKCGRSRALKYTHVCVCGEGGGGGVEEMTYENAKNRFSKKCRKWKMTPYSKMLKVKQNLRQKRRELISQNG